MITYYLSNELSKIMKTEIELKQETYSNSSFLFRVADRGTATNHLFNLLSVRVLR